MGIIFLTWLCICAACDAVYRKCFNWLVILGIGTALFSAVLIPKSQPMGVNWSDSFLGTLTGFFCFALFYFSKLMGAGDVKFAAALGAWVGWKILLPIWLVSCFFAVMHGFFSRSQLGYLLGATAKINNDFSDENRRFVPYVTYLCIATIIVIAIYKS